MTGRRQRQRHTRPRDNPRAAAVPALMADACPRCHNVGVWATVRPVRGFPGLLLGLTLVAEAGSVLLSWGLEPAYDTLLYAVYSVILSGTGALIAVRHPRNAVGWLFCWCGLINAVSADLAQAWGLRGAAHGWPGAPAGEWVANWSWLPGAAGLVLTFLLFPDGRLPTRSWRPTIWATIVGLVLALPGWAFSPRRGPDFVGGQNPFAVTWIPTDTLFAVGLALVCGALVASVASLVLRFRGSRGLERQQLKWFVYVAVLVGLVLPPSAVLWEAVPAVRLLPAVALTALPLAAGAAILRFHLYDIDVVINRTLVYGALTAVLAASYTGVAVLLSKSLGGGSEWATAGAAVAVTVLFRPVRARIQDAVDRRFDRARYHARYRMSAFLEQLRAGEAVPEDVQKLLREVLGDPALDLVFWLPDAGPCVDLRGAPVDLVGDERERMEVVRGEQRLAQVLHRPLDPPRLSVARMAVDDGTLAIEMARLRVELRRQLATVEESRARIIEAGDQERRRIERDLHDGAQQRLVSIGLALRHAQHQLCESRPEPAKATLNAAVTEIAGTIQELRDLTHGLPPSQLDEGLAPAFRELARRAPLPVGVAASNERFDARLEAAAYFISCEGLTNAVKHAQATRVDLSARRIDESLIVSVADDGTGGAAVADGSGLSGLADRVTALGGTLTIHSEPGIGTTLTAELPCGS
jgi:signal transduction histidine kinase